MHVSVFHSFLGPNTISLYGYIIFCLSIHLLFSTFWKIMNNLSNKHSCISFCVVISFHLISRSGIVNSYGNSMLSHYRNWQTASQSGCTILHLPYQGTIVPTSSHPYRHLLSEFFILVILMGVKSYLSMLLICISLKTNDAQNLFMYLLAIWRSSEIVALWMNSFLRSMFHVSSDPRRTLPAVLSPVLSAN